MPSMADWVETINRAFQSTNESANITAQQLNAAFAAASTQTQTYETRSERYERLTALLREGKLSFKDRADYEWLMNERLSLIRRRDRATEYLGTNTLPTIAPGGYTIEGYSILDEDQTILPWETNPSYYTYSTRVGGQNVPIYNRVRFENY